MNSAPIDILPMDLQRVHMVGIGGAGMSGIARILLARGGQVSGSDAKESRGVLALRARGALIRIGHDESALDMLAGGPTAVVTTHAAIPKDNPELLEAARRGIPIILRPVVLEKLMQGRQSILVAGTHGKTSTTSMLIVALQHCGMDPSFAVGGELNEAGTNAHHGSGSVFVAEADESDGSLLQYTPNIVVVTNVESDHLDFFGNEQAYIEVFDKFVDRIPIDGVLIACLDDPGSAALIERAEKKGIRVCGYGSIPDGPSAVSESSASGASLRLEAGLISWSPKDVGGIAVVQLSAESAPRTLRLAVPGRHMALNALGALLAARESGAAVDVILDGLASFGGVHRRFQLSGVVSGTRVFDDYAHHPTEVRAVLTAARELVKNDNEVSGRVVVIFQPHLYSRTATFAAEFASALDLADIVIVLDVYGAREEPLPGVSGAMVAQGVTKEVHYQPDLSRVAQQVSDVSSSGDVIITMGAGDVTMLGTEILAALRNKRFTNAIEQKTTAQDIVEQRGGGE
ncbi:MAG: UDP-N-acetylmuramate--L-alanine ligase [Mycobacteriaceae bacterium]